MRYHYAYVPYNRVKDVERDAMFMDGLPAGRLIAAPLGEEIEETRREMLDGRYAIPLTRREAERFFTRSVVERTREWAD